VENTGFRKECNTKKREIDIKLTIERADPSLLCDDTKTGFMSLDTNRSNIFAFLVLNIERKSRAYVIAQKGNPANFHSFAPSEVFPADLSHKFPALFDSVASTRIPPLIIRYSEQGNEETAIADWPGVANYPVP
jgi:hypothetical protein